MPRHSLAIVVVLSALVPTLPVEASSIISTPREWARQFEPESGPKVEVPSYANALERLRAELTAGKYRYVLSELSEQERYKFFAPADVVTVRARALYAIGRVEEARKLLKTSPAADDPQVLLTAGRLALTDNDAAYAERAADRLLKQDKSLIAGHLLHGQALEALGRYEEAKVAYKWFTEGEQHFLQEWMARPDGFENAEDLCDIATAIDRWATLTLAYKDVKELNEQVLGMYVRSFDVVDRSFFEGRIRAAEFAASRGNFAAATTFIEGAEAQAPRNVDLLTLVAELQLRSDPAALAQTIATLRDIDPESPVALMFEARNLVRTQQVASAANPAAKLVNRRPNDPVAIGLDAAIRYILGNKSAVEVALNTAGKNTPSFTEVALEAADNLYHTSQNDVAADLLKSVIDRMPWRTEARHLLGAIYINVGDEANARKVLEQAYAIDPYNVVSVNYIRLLDDLVEYDRQETEHFIIYFKRRTDPIMGDQLAPFFEETYADLAKVFDYEPKEKVIVQLFATDDEFSVRMAGVPGIENYGVSFGRVLAAVSPRADTAKGNYNISRVLRHELVHTFNLLQTQFRCPRWLTEGLAVWQEGVPFRFKEVPAELYQRTMNDKLFTVHGLANAFIAPTSSSDGEQAYTQGAWLAKYLDETYGRESIHRLLQGYADSLSDDDAFVKATGQPVDVVQRDWHEWMKIQISPWNFDKATGEKVTVLEEEGEAALKTRQFAQAQTVWESILAQQPNAIKPHQRLAYIYLQKETANPAKAIEHLKWLHVFELANNRMAKQICRLYMQEDDLQSALEWARQATFVDSYDASAHELLAEVLDKMHRSQDAAGARQTGEQIKLLKQIKDAAQTKPPVPESSGQ